MPSAAGAAVACRLFWWGKAGGRCRLSPFPAGPSLQSGGFDTAPWSFLVLGIVREKVSHLRDRADEVSSALLPALCDGEHDPCPPRFPDIMMQSGVSTWQILHGHKSFRDIMINILLQ